MQRYCLLFGHPCKLTANVDHKISIISQLVLHNQKSTFSKTSYCIQNKISDFERMPKDSRPNSITKYLYKNNTTYYIRTSCCDQYNPVYDGTCTYLGAPAGGFTGKGDGKLTDFFANATNKKVVWENK